MKIPAQKIELAASKMASCYVTTDVLLDVENQLLVATDGHAMAVVPVITEKGDTTGMISQRAFKVAREGIKRVKARLRFEAAKLFRIQALKKLVVRCPAHDETTVLYRPRLAFAKNWKAVIPQRTGAPDLVFNLEVLANLVAALRTPSDRCSDVVKLWIDKSKQPTESAILVSVGVDYGERCGLGVMMPMRHDGLTAEQVLARIKPVEKEEAKAEEKPEAVHA